MSTLLTWLNDGDLNGECFISGEAGELEELRESRKVYFAPNTPVANAPMQPVAFTNDQASEFIALNATKSAAADGVAISAKHCKIAYLRYLAVRCGLISPAFRAADYFVKYNEAVRLTSNGYTRITDENAKVPQSMLSDADRKKLRENFGNIVCCVAYEFRVRGHHWIPEIDANYTNLWKKCIKDEVNPGLEWQFIAHDALHAIYPLVLDQFWTYHKDRGNLAGTLIKRWDSAPAGVAAIKAVYVGATDLQMAVPGIRDKFRHLFDELDGIVANMKANRWAGSINRRYYNAGNLEFDEQRFGAIASVVYNSLNAFAANSPLLKSKALERVANNAPITGGIVSRSIATAASNPRIVEQMLLPATNQPSQ